MIRQLNTAILALLMGWSAHAGSLMPVEGTAVAREVDSIYIFLVIASFISFVILIGGMIYFAVKYRRRTPTDKTAYITGNHTLEFLWSFIPFLIFMFVFAWGWKVFHEMRSFPDDAIEVHVMAKKWEWRFLYKNGREVTATLDSANRKIPATMVVPIGRPVKLIMASEKIVNGSKDPLDRPVLHSFFIPAFRIKQDVVPGRYTALWFKAEKLGTYNVFCAEYCGAGHSGMRGLINVVTEEEYENWISSEASGEMSLADKGKAIYTAKACVGCHSLDGSRLVGPSFKGIWGHPAEIEGGGQANVDENYVRESVLNPNAKVVKSYPAGVMPTFAGQLSDDDVKAVIEFIKSVK